MKNNPIIVKITKQKVVTSYRIKGGPYCTLWYNEGIAEDGKCYLWSQTLFSNDDGTTTSGSPNNFMEIKCEQTETKE